ncbi:uncharacterized protein LOC143922440 [Arctopsyche grandis]|uniref:uncharacterized protein LOC143922440 n=1 Tax=Arctopsyche grandis TaxID=121162 RepID=UPI00406D7213
MAAEIDVGRVCRTCLCEGGADMQPVFPTTPLKGGASLSTMVNYCTQLQFVEGDGLPVQICCKCLESVTNAFSFKLQAETADAKLRNYIAGKHSKPLLSSSTSIKEEDDSENLVIKTEIKMIEDDYESNYEEDYAISPCNVGSDDSEEDFKPLKDLKDEAIKKTLDLDHSKKNSQKLVPCQFCNKTFLNLINLENHKQKYHPGFVQCDICLRAFTKLSYLERHKIASHTSSTSGTVLNKKDKVEFNPPVSCTLCDFTFSREEQLISHIALSHNGPRKRGRPSKKDILLNKLKLKKLLETMNIKTEADDFDVSENPVEFFDGIPTSPLDLEPKVEIFSESNKIGSNYCSFCCKTFSSSSSYDKHIRKHIGHKPSFCKICNKTFKYTAALKEHLQSHNSIESFADLDLKSKINLLENHEKILGMKLENLSNDYVTQLIISDIKAEKFDLYMEEMKIDPEDQILSDSDDSDCNQTNGAEDVDEIHDKKLKIFINKSKVKQGFFKLRKYKIHKCSLCNQSFSRSNHIMRHMSTHNFNYPDKCEICEKVFPNKDLLTKHKRMQCENTTKTFQCGTCDMKFTYEMSLNKHILKHHKGESVSVNFLDPVYQKREKTFICSTCNKSFYRKDHLDNHAKVHMPNEKKFECPICQKKFNRKDNLRSHSRVHETNKEDLDSNCLCVYCGRSFSNSSNLIVHMRRHTGEKPYKCDICGKGFPRSSDLQCHRRTHTGEKPCLCTICGKGFSRSNKLVRHMRIHTGQRPYKCTYCERAFTQSNDLTLHIRRHTGDKPYVCGVCGDRFIQGTALQAHRRMHSHYEEGAQPPFIPSNSVNSPNRTQGVNRVSIIGTKSQLTVTTTTCTSTSQVSNTVTTSTSSSNSNRVSTARSHSYMANGVSSFLASSSLLLQNMSDVPNAISNIPLFSLQHYNQGYN